MNVTVCVDVFVLCFRLIFVRIITGHDGKF